MSKNNKNESSRPGTVRSTRFDQGRRRCWTGSSVRGAVGACARHPGAGHSFRWPSGFQLDPRDGILGPLLVLAAVLAIMGVFFVLAAAGKRAGVESAQSEQARAEQLIDYFFNASLFVGMAIVAPTQQFVSSTTRRAYDRLPRA